MQLFLVCSSSLALRLCVKQEQKISLSHQHTPAIRCKSATPPAPKGENQRTKLQRAFRCYQG